MNNVVSGGKITKAGLAPVSGYIQGSTAPEDAIAAHLTQWENGPLPHKDTIEHVRDQIDQLIPFHKAALNTLLLDRLPHICPGQASILTALAVLEGKMKL